MHKIIYAVNPEIADSEVDWLRSQGVYPSVSTRFRHSSQSVVSLIGAIVPEPVMAMIILKHGNLDHQSKY